MQVVETTARIKNVERPEYALGGAKHVAEGEAVLAPVPGTDRQYGESVLVCVLGEPGDEECVDEADEGRDTQDGSLCSGRGVGEAKQLLQVLETRLDLPAMMHSLWGPFMTAGPSVAVLSIRASAQHAERASGPVRVHPRRPPTIGRNRRADDRSPSHAAAKCTA